MKPSTLRGGAKVRRITGGNVWTFVRLERDSSGRASVAVLQSDACRGLNGPDDAGLATVTVAELAQRFEVTA
jgi:hypothetical protein